MRSYVYKGKAFVLVVLAIGLAFNLQAQTTVRGTVRDALTHAPMPFVSIYFKGSNGTVSAKDGTYSLTTTNPKNNAIVFSYTGYVSANRQVAVGTTQQMDIELELESLSEVVVTSKKRGKYRNKDNPAVELIRKVIDHKSANRITSYQFAQYEQYEKMELFLTNTPAKLMKSKLLRNYRFLMENQDTTKVPGRALLPVYMEETLSDKYFRKDPYKEKTYILGKKKVDFGSFIDNNGVSNYLNSMYGNVDLYENNVTILTSQFLSPIADVAPTFYRFYIRDTIELDGIKLIELYFSPRNTNGLLFRGTLYVTLDGNYAVQKVKMSVGKGANLNWTRELHINQDFERGEDGRYRVIMSNMLAEFALTRNSDRAIMGERTVSLKNYVINKPAPDSVYSGKTPVAVENAAPESDSFWVARRHEPLSASEANVYTNMDSLTHMRSYRRLMDWGTLLLAGYKRAGPFDIGPVNAFYSFNPVEGFRLRVGGRSSERFSKSIYLETYAAYGFKDEKLKYYLSGAYAFNKKSVYTYPNNFLRIGYQYDTKIPGQELQFVQEDNFLLSFKRGDNSKWLYNNIFTAEYVREFGKNLRITTGFKNWKQQAAGSIVYEKFDGSNKIIVPDVTTSELSAELRWAPKEQFYQGTTYRIPIYNKYPIFRLRYTAGINGLVNGQYNYQRLNLNAFKRFYLSQLGYAEIVLDGGYTFGQVPYPLLTIHRANQTYAYQFYSYNLMNFMEFVSDHYAAATIDYYLNGLLFNRIPLLRKLKWREATGIRILYGGMRNENNPYSNPNALIFPTDVNGNPTTFILGKTPYMEANVGIANIFKVFRVDVIKRLTYLNNPLVSEWGIRGRFRLEF